MSNGKVLTRVPLQSRATDRRRHLAAQADFNAIAAS